MNVFEFLEKHVFEYLESLDIQKKYKVTPESIIPDWQLIESCQEIDTFYLYLASLCHNSRCQKD